MMKTNNPIFGLALLLFSCFVFAGCPEKIMEPPPPPPPEFNCRAFWASFSLEEFCGLDVIEQYWGSEDDELCGFQIHPFGESWPHDDVFFIFLYEASDLDEAMLVHSMQRTDLSSEEGFSLITDVGDEGFIVDYNDPVDSYEIVYHFRKGVMVIDILFMNLDCFTEEMVHEMAQKIADNL